MLHALEVLSSAWRTKHGISANEQLVIGMLATTGSHTPKDLSVFVGVTTGGMSTLLDRLEARGYVQRNIKSDDRRRVLVTLTKSGLQANMDREQAHATLEQMVEEYAGPESYAMKRLLTEGEAMVLDCAQQMSAAPSLTS